MPSPKPSRAALFAVAFVLLASPGSAFAERTGAGLSPWSTDGFRGGADTRLTGRSAVGIGGSAQHGPVSQHLPAVRENIELVGRMSVDTPDQYKLDPLTLDPDTSQPDVVPGQIADVAVYKNAAYLMSWSEPSCKRGGFFSVDISNPAEPRQLAFVPALPDTYHGEGAHAITLNTGGVPGRRARRQQRALRRPDGVGGFDLYDVTDPAAPGRSSRARGDQSPDGGGTGGQDPAARRELQPLDLHLAGRPAGVRRDRRTTPRSHDVDIFDITDPRAPEHIADLDLDASWPPRRASTSRTTRQRQRDLPPRHGRQADRRRADDARLLLGRGLRAARRQRPGEPEAHRRHGLRRPDRPATDAGLEPPEGNGHQAEFSHDNRFVLAADEDFSTYRHATFEITSGPNAGPYAVRGVRLRAADRHAARPERSTGRRSTAATAARPTTRSRRADTGARRGRWRRARSRSSCVQRGPVDDPAEPYDGRAASTRRCRTRSTRATRASSSPTTTPGQTRPSRTRRSAAAATRATIRGMCIGHRGDAPLFNDAPDYDRAVHARTASRRSATLGEDVAGARRVRRLGLHAPVPQHRRPSSRRSTTSPSRRRVDERYAIGFGDLSMHEFATDPDENLAYSLVLRGRHAGVHVRRRRPDAGRQVHRRGRQQLLGRRAVHDAARRPPVRRLGPRLRAVPVPVHRAGRGAEAGVRGPGRHGPVRDAGDRVAAVHGRQRQPR